MSVLLWFFLITAIAMLVYFASRPITYFDDPVKARGRYVVFNRMMGNVCFDGRTFRSPKAAQKLFERTIKKDGLNFPEMFEIRQVL